MQQAEVTNEKFLSTLSSSLHGLAQPLSIIHGYLEISLLKATSVEQYRELIEKMLQESRRATGIAQFVAQLTRFQHPAPDVKEVMVSSVVTGAIEDMSRVFERAQIELLFRHPEEERPVRISPVRLRQVIFYILEVIRTVSVAGDVIWLELAPEDDHLNFQIRRESNSGQASKVIPSIEENNGNRALALADAIISNAGGTFVGSLEPLSIRAEFPTS